MKSSILSRSAGILACLALISCASNSATSSSEDAKVPGTFSLNSVVTDAGETISQAVIYYGDVKIQDKLTAEDFTVISSGSSSYIHGEDVVGYGDYKDVERTITNVEVVDGGTVVLDFVLNEQGSGTLSYLSSARNVPLELDYSIKQNSNIQITAKDGTELPPLLASETLSWDKTINNGETSVFTSVKDSSKKIAYQLYKAEASGKPLLVWFHGNGEGDFASSRNNLAQMLGNRGTVAWVSEEAKNAFGDMSVMAFQAPDTWYLAQKDGLLEAAYDEIQAVIKQTKADKNRIYVAGCSAGGYMTSRMIMAYPALFAAANINCPAYDVATERGGETPTDEELLKLVSAKTKIWLVQADNDPVVKTADCGDRLYGFFKGNEVAADIKGGKTFERGGLIYTKYYTVTATNNGSPMLVYEEDYDKDGIMEQVQYNGHWSWIHSLNNDPIKADGTKLFDWMASQHF